jgi:hypothetical protein
MFKSWPLNLSTVVAKLKLKNSEMENVLSWRKVMLGKSRAGHQTNGPTFFTVDPICKRDQC